MVVAYYYKRGRPSVDVERPLAQIVTEPLHQSPDGSRDADQRPAERSTGGPRRSRGKSCAERASLFA